VRMISRVRRSGLLTRRINRGDRFSLWSDEFLRVDHLGDRQEARSSCTIPVDRKPAICPCICRGAFPATGASTIWPEPLRSIRRDQFQCRHDHGMAVHAIPPGFSHGCASYNRPDDICHPKIGSRNHVTLTVQVEHSAAVNLLPSQNMGVNTVTPYVLLQPGIAQVAEKNGGR
jgi:hypothetical protein